MVVYLTTHVPTGRKYIGKDSANYSQYFGSGTEIKEIIRKEGKSNFTKVILEYCSSKEELAQREEYWLKKYDVENDPMFMNRTNKAFGNSGLSEETKRKISLASMGKPKSQTARENMSKGKMGKKRKQTKTRSDKGKIKGPNPLISLSSKSRDRSYSFKPVIQYDLEGNIVREYKSAAEAKTITGLKIQNALVGIAKTSGGFIWKYK